MGSCVSHESKPDGKTELATNIEDTSTKIEAAQMHKISAMSSSDKQSYIQSPEFAEYLRLCSINKKDVFQDILSQATPNDTKSLLSNIKSIQQKIKKLNDDAPGPSNPNHTQFIGITHYYQISFESSLNEYLKVPNTLESTLQQTFKVLTKIVQVLNCLVDDQLKPEERWWGTGKDHSKLHGELDSCKVLFEEPMKEIATGYLAELYGQLSLRSDTQKNNNNNDKDKRQDGLENSERISKKEDTNIGGAENGSEKSTGTAAASAGKALNLYLPSLYKESLEQVMARQ